jgi:hypothetical protein
VQISYKEHMKEEEEEEENHMNNAGFTFDLSTIRFKLANISIILLKFLTSKNKLSLL